MLRVGSQYTKDVRLGDQPLARVYQGDSLVWQPPAVTMTVETAEFFPEVTLHAGSTATIDWRVDGASVATGLTPSIVFADAGPRQIEMICSASDEVRSLNLGFAHNQDSGIENIGSSYNHRTQGVTSITGLTSLSNLVYFMAARTNSSGSWSGYNGPLLSGHLDLSGLASLEHVECYRNNIESIDLTGCSSLRRLCIEGTNMTELDLNPVASTLYDLRAADMQGGALHLTAMTSALANLYHFCVRTQYLTGLPDHAVLTAVQQYWPWDCGLDEDEVLIRSSRPLDSVRFTHQTINGPSSTIRRLDLAGQTFASSFPSEPEQRVEAWDVGMQSVDMTGMGPVDAIRLQDNLLPESDVDHVLAVANSWGTSGGVLLLAGNAAPSTAGVSSASALIGRGWTVTYTAPEPIPDGEAPSVPDNFTAGTPTATTVPTTWSAATDNIGVVGYETSIDGTIWTPRGDVLGYTFTGLAPETSYTLRVRAYDAAGNRGPEVQVSATTIAGDPDRILLWSDEFDRADATGFANSGGWYPGRNDTDTDVAIQDGALVLSGPTSYRTFLHPAGGNLPSDVEVEVGFTIDEPGDPGTYWGVVNRWFDNMGPDGIGNGVRLLFRNDGMTVSVGLASNSSNGTIYDISSLVPSGWTDPGQHTITLKGVGEQLYVLCDGVEVLVHTISNYNQPGGAVGLCGEAQDRAWDYIRVYAVPVPETGLLWADEFDRPDTTGWANVGNGWVQPILGSGAVPTGDMAIESERLVLTSPEVAYHLFRVYPDVLLPEDFRVELEFEVGPDVPATDGYFGILAHLDPAPTVTSDGIKCMFASDPTALPRLSNTISTGGGVGIPAAGAGIPATWMDPGVHTMAVEFRATSVRLYLDGQLAGESTDINTARRSGGGLGICGEANGRAWRALRVYALDP